MFEAINLKKLGISLIIPLATGFLSFLLSKNGMEIYQDIKVPPLSPPGAIFPVVWTILYLMMGISLYMVKMSSAKYSQKKKGYIFYGLQLVFNFFWSIIFFNAGAYTFSAIWLAVMIVFIILNIYYFSGINNSGAYLLVPYLIWSLFALYLNIGIVILN